MQHLGTQTLQSNRLELRKIRLDDAEAMFRNWATDEAVTKYLVWPPHDSLDTTKAVIQSWVMGYHEADFYQWAIVPKDLNEPIGTISVVEQDSSIEMVHIGYCIGQQWWGQGYMSEALERIIQFFFEDVKLNRIESQHDVANPGSGRVMEKCGMHYEGTSRQSAKNNQGICDTMHYAILAEDYRAMKNG